MTPHRRWTTDFGGIDALKLSTAAAAPAAAALGATQVLLRIHAVALNYRDYEVVAGQYNHHKGQAAAAAAALVPCSDFGAAVVAVGAGVTRVAPGDRVLSIFNTAHVAGDITQALLRDTGLGLPLDGVLQDFRVLDQMSLVRVPAAMSYAQAATLPIAAGTAWTALYGLQPLKPGQTVLVLGTGGVSIFALQIAALARATVIVTSSSDAKLAKARALGATHTINYRTTPAWDEEVMRLTGGRGADQIIECGGQDTLARSFNAVRFGGLINAVGYLGGKATSDDQMGVAVMALRRWVTYKGILIGSREVIEELVRFCEATGLQPVIDSVFPFERAPDAFRHLKEQRHVGKIVIQVAPEGEGEELSVNAVNAL